MSTARKFSVTAVSSYKDNNGEVRDQFSRVGVAFRNTSKKDGRESISLLIGPEILISKRTRLVLFEWDEDEKAKEPSEVEDINDDEIPF